MAFREVGLWFSRIGLPDLRPCFFLLSVSSFGLHGAVTVLRSCGFGEYRERRAGVKLPHDQKVHGTIAFLNSECFLFSSLVLLGKKVWGVVLVSRL